MEIRELIKDKIAQFAKNQSLKPDTNSTCPTSEQSKIFDGEIGTEFLDCVISQLLLEDEEILIYLLGEELYYSKEFFDYKMCLLGNEPITN